MIWLQPWAWLGLLALAVPVLIHLLGRRNARTQPFPTLRFFAPSQLRLSSRTRLTDLPLLAVRLGILGCAVAALAQPYWLTGNRQTNLNRALARAIVLDTSASMLRMTPAGTAALTTARQEAQRLAEQADFSVILESEQPAQQLAGASQWLSRQPARRELWLVSDFQIGTLDPQDLAAVSPAAGVQLRRIEVRPDDVPLERVAQQGERETVARVSLSLDHTDVEWITRRSADLTRTPSIGILAGPTERSRALAAQHAARSLASAATRDDQAVVIIFPEYERGNEMLRAARPLDRPWMADLSARIRDDARLVAAVAHSAVPGDGTLPATVTVLARSDEGHPVVLAASGTLEDTQRLLLFVRTDAGSLTSAALFAAIQDGLSSLPPLSEIEPRQLSDEQLRQLERPAATIAQQTSDHPGDASDGRWLWLVVLLLLFCESWLRRSADRDRPLEPAS